MKDMKMSNKKDISLLENKLLEFAEEKLNGFASGEPGFVFSQRKQALESFKESGLPHKKLEKWRNTDLWNWYQKPFSPETSSEKFTQEVNDIFECTVQDFDT